MKKLIIKTNDAASPQTSLSFSGEVSVEDAFLMLFSAIGSIAQNQIASTPPDQQEEARSAYADAINFAASNVLNAIAPKQDDADIDEHIILQCENEAIEYARTHNLTIQDVITLLKKGDLHYGLQL